MELGIYIHIPFCMKKCYYCDFISYENKLDLQEAYIKKIVEEIRQNNDIIKNKNVTTIYIGGGTPSTIKAEYIKLVLEEIYNILGNNNNRENIEITIEVNPGTITEEKMKIYKESGINRISIGLQSINDTILKTIGRIHNYEQFLKTYDIAKKEGFSNVNIDLMLGLPNQTIDDLKKSLKEVTKLKPTHISVYSLIVEQGTPIEKMINDGKLTLPNENEERTEYAYTKNYLELKGYKHYEISNFAKEGFESKHNVNCWEQKEYLGFGIAAHSYIDGIRYSNTCDLNRYLNSNSDDVKTIHEKQNKSEMEKEYMLLGLRKIKGISISEFKNKFGENPVYLFRNELNKLVKNDLLIVNLDNIKLTDKGLDFANLVWEEFV